jgi:hypothetical protein
MLRSRALPLLPFPGQSEHFAHVAAALEQRTTRPRVLRAAPSPRIGEA